MFNVKHTRGVTKEDNYYIVEIHYPNGIISFVGWIEKSFIVDNFRETFGDGDYKIVDVIVFDNKEDYEKAKRGNETKP